MKKIHDAMKGALFDPATQAVMATYNMPTLYLDTAAYDKAAREQEKIEREQPEARRHARGEELTPSSDSEHEKAKQ